MKVVFLDIDGVLCHMKQRHGCTGSYLDQMDKYNLKCFAEKQKEHGFKVVISSTWRIGKTKEEMEENFKVNGCPLDLHDDWRTTTRDPYSTDDLTSETFNQEEMDIINKQVSAYGGFESIKHQRGFQIHHWLKNHPEVEQYLIIDDETDMLPLVDFSKHKREERYLPNFLHVYNGEMTGGLNMFDFIYIDDVFKGLV